MKSRSVVVTGGGRWEELTTREQNEGLLGGNRPVLCLGCVVAACVNS